VLVVNNLKRLNNVFRRNMADAEGSALLRKLEQGDEIEELVEGMEQMGDHLYEARRQLQDYAENLRQSSSRTELWRLALPQICTRFEASRIAYVCTMASQNYFVWPESDESPEMPEDLVGVLTGSSCMQSGRFPGLVVIAVHSGGEALRVLAEKPAQLMITDLRMPEMTGQQLLSQALALQPELSMVVLTAYGTIETAVKALRAGAYDFLTKPIEPEQLFRVVEKGLERSRLLEENSRMRQNLASKEAGGELVGEGAAMRQLKRPAFCAVVGSRPAAASLLRGLPSPRSSLVQSSPRSPVVFGSREIIPIPCITPRAAAWKRAGRACRSSSG
jgi:CheY-like chemotaxis protein